MKCQECELLLEEFLDGELDARAAERVRAHTAECADCADALGALAAEQSLYAAYEREVEVTPQLWGGIEERIAAGRRVEGEMGLLQRVSVWLAPLLTAPRFSPALTAALLVIAVLGTVGAMRFLDPRGGGELASKGTPARTDDPTPANVGGGASDPNAPNAPASESRPAQVAANPTPARPAAPSPELKSSPEQSATPARRTASGPPPKKGVRERLAPGAGGEQLQSASLGAQKRGGEQSPDRLIREAEKRYQAAIRILERDVRGRRSQLDRETLARFDETLSSIDRTIAETRKAVRQQAGDPVAVQYMLSAYAKKVEVMREMAHLGQGN